eukprot:167918-Hanusia_phi.AAC.1
MWGLRRVRRGTVARPGPGPSGQPLRLSATDAATRSRPAPAAPDSRARPHPGVVSAARRDHDTTTEEQKETAILNLNSAAAPQKTAALAASGGGD